MTTYEYVYIYPPKEGFSSICKVPDWKFYSYDQNGLNPVVDRTMRDEIFGNLGRRVRIGGKK